MADVDARSDRLSVAVLGPGGVGGLLAGALARQGAAVRCLAMPQTAEEINRRGLSISSERIGQFQLPVSGEERLSAPVEVICIAVKATALEQSLERLPLEVVGDAVLIPFQNGFEHLALLRSCYPAAMVIGATIWVESARIAPGVIVQSSPFLRVVLASVPPIRSTVESFAALLGEAGFDVDLRDDERMILWEKLNFLAPLALLTTFHRVPAGHVRTEHRADLLAAIEEIAEVAAAEGAHVDSERVIRQFDSVPETTQSSMQRDDRAGRPLEVEAIGGAILRAAEREHVEVPTIERLVAALRGRSA